MTNPVNNGSLLSNEPVLAAHAAGAVVAYVFSELVTHGVLTTTSASNLTQLVVPPVSALFLVLLGLFVRHFVTPAAKVAAALTAATPAAVDAGPVIDVAAQAEATPAPGSVAQGAALYGGGLEQTSTAGGIEAALRVN